LTHHRLRRRGIGDFLAGVTGHEAAHAAGEAIADERLGRTKATSGLSPE
jgi:hypothetical protein